MTYREFLLLVLLPALIVAAAGLAVRYARTTPAHRARLRRGLVLAGLLSVTAVVYTTVWVRWLIVHSVWGYPPHSVLGTVFSVPIEEYLFMIGQTALTGCWTLLVEPADPPFVPAPRGSARRIGHTIGWLAVAAVGAVLALHQRSLYLGAILFWFGPPLALQAAVGADVLRAFRRRRLIGLAITVGLWVADAVAIDKGAWWLSPEHTIGLRFFGLPVEEAVFFLCTNLLIVNSILLVSTPAMRARLPVIASEVEAAP
jgi:lycopene cyclase domain-containing protein